MKFAMLIVVSVLLAGCQWFQSSAQTSFPTSASVMSMWDLYRHCQSSGDVETVLSAAKQLQQSADTHAVPAPDVPKTLDRFVTKQPVRTTVDPKALAASCTLQAARTSLNAGRDQEAEQLLHAVVSSYPESDYTFYVAQAKFWIEELHSPGALNSVVHPIVHY
jgi:TolA-binding protein